jgi:phosphomannomutase
MSQPIISVSGLRGIVGESLTPELVVRYVAAFAAELPSGPVLVAYDGRATGPVYVSIALATLAAAGRHAFSAGVAATPTVGVLVAKGDYAGAVQISASHNPAEYNGIKLFGGDGRVLPAVVGERVKARYLAGNFVWPTHEQVGMIQTVPDTVTDHLGRVLATVDFAAIRRQKFRVLLDANHGSGSILGKELLEALGCQITLLGGVPNGQFAHLPEPTAENLADVCQQVAHTGSVAGFCQDPDADRLALIDETGRYIGEEKTLAICVDHVLRSTPGPVVTNCSTSRMTQDLAEQHGCAFTHAAVGEANVVDEMQRVGAVIGGEGNGGVIHPQVVWVRDSIVGMALVLDAMTARRLPLSQLADELPSYAIHKAKVTLASDKVAAALEALEQHFAEAKPNRRDGLRLDWPAEKKWLLVRASNTEPIVRIFAEAGDEAVAQELCEVAGRVMAGV